MRIRSIKPAWWSDHDLQTRLTAAEREFYIGLWQQADDAGWLSWDVHRIGAELYPYRSAKTRAAFIEAAAEKLAGLDPDAPHLFIEKCGHARVPKMPLHQHQSGKPVYTVLNEHGKCPKPLPPQIPAEPRGEPPTPAVSRHGNGKGSNGEGSKGKAARGREVHPWNERALAS